MPGGIASVVARMSYASSAAPPPLAPVTSADSARTGLLPTCSRPRALSVRYWPGGVLPAYRSGTLPA